MQSAALVLRLSGWLYVLCGVSVGVLWSPVGYFIAVMALIPFWLAVKVEHGSRFGIGATCLLFLIYVFSIFLPLGVWGLVSLWRDKAWRSA